MKKDKSPKSTKVLKWHGNAEQMNISVYHPLQSCGVQVVSYLKTRIIMKLIFQPQQSYLDLKILVFHSPLVDYYQWLKVHTSGIREIQVAGRIQ